MLGLDMAQYIYSKEEIRDQRRRFIFWFFLSLMVIGSIEFIAIMGGDNFTQVTGL